MPKAILFIVGLFAISFLNFSWIIIVAYGLFLFSTLVWVVSVKLQRRTCQRIFKYMLIGALIFTIGFSTFENYLCWNVGYPSTFDSSHPNVTISYPNILGVSLVEIVQDIKDTPAFSLLTLEYPGEILLTQVILNTRIAAGGEISLRFFHVASNWDLLFSSHDGSSYVASTIIWNRVREFPSQQTPDTSLRQIDNLGLQWFYERTIEECQNKSAVNKIRTSPEVTDLRIAAVWDDYEIYQGLTLQMTCFFEDQLSRLVSFTAVFQPNGTVLSGDFTIHPTR
ncbi:MAG: hypothetical protein LBI79_06150 [Nitrososphaerota archaeon]|nr:hypothetical protein [Nitrososphaerota archaeon]